MSDSEKILANLKQEMRRGSLVLAVLTQLDPEVIDTLKLGTSIGFRIGFLAILTITLIEIFKHLKIILNKNNAI
ncbi:MAG: hypothetical protein RBR71_08730 [Gudongella sp.]|nr:hypothetical protein [Gudongella sp.]